MELKYLQEIDADRKYHFWYGGDVVELFYNDEIQFVISAIGDVIGNLYNDKEHLVYFKDKNNMGYFYEEVSKYIKNDKELEECMTCDFISENDIDNNKGKLISFDNNNWWEVFLVINGQYIDIMCSLASYSIDEAVDEVIENIDNLLQYIYQYYIKQ